MPTAPEIPRIPIPVENLDHTFENIEGNIEKEVRKIDPTHNVAPPIVQSPLSEEDLRRHGIDPRGDPQERIYGSIKVDTEEKTSEEVTQVKNVFRRYFKGWGIGKTADIHKEKLRREQLRQHKLGFRADSYQEEEPGVVDNSKIVEIGSRHQADPLKKAA